MGCLLLVIGLIKAPSVLIISCIFELLTLNVVDVGVEVDVGVLII